MELNSNATHERWLSVDEIAQHLGVSKVSIYRWADAGEIPAHKVGRQWKFKATEVDGWVRREAISDKSFSPPQKQISDERKEI